MTRPGPVFWGTNDDHPAGGDPWSGNPLKVEPPQSLKEQGMLPEGRIAAQYFNWLHNQLAGHAQRNARARASEAIQRALSTALPPAVAGYNLCSHCYEETMDIYTFLMSDNVSGVAEVQSYGGVFWIRPAALVYAGGGVSGADADASHDGRRMVVAIGPAVLDAVSYSDLLGAWGAATIVGAPGLAFTAIGCDRDTNGQGYARWLIGNDPGGAAAPSLYVSINVPPAAPSFANLGTFPGLANGRIIRAIAHSNHPAGALGPAGSGTGQDPGNPTWLVMTDVEALRSADGVNWFQANHGLTFGANGPDVQSIAYSRTACRWVVMLGGANIGDVAISDDNGASWQGISNALPGATDNNQEIMLCDGYGTFLATNGQRYWVSVDDGENWTELFFPFDIAGYTQWSGVGFDSTVGHGDTPTFGGSFVHAFHDPTAPDFAAFQSLRS